MSVQFDFKDKVVLITGSSSGIGAGTALLFSKSGAKVVITGRNERKLSEVAKKCQQLSPNGYKPLQVLGDITREEDAQRLVKSTINEFGKLDVLVNNAGFGCNKGLKDPDYMTAYRDVLNTNLTSVVYLTHLCAEHLTLTKGNVVNVSSVAAFSTVSLDRIFT